MKNHLFLLLGILFGCTTNHNELRVSYIANCGFLYESQSANIVIDPFGTDFGDFFFLPSSEVQTNLEISIAGVTVTAVRMQHGTDRNLEGIAQEEYTDYEKTENYGYLIDFNQKLLFHQGDGCLKINQSAIEQLNRNVDIAHLSFFDWDPISYQLLKEKLHAKNIIFMHGTKPGNELGTEELRSIAPKVIFFKQELESKLF